jgi:hypothetical protein
MPGVGFIVFLVFLNMSFSTLSWAEGLEGRFA